MGHVPLFVGNASRPKDARDTFQTRLNWFFHSGVMWSPWCELVFVVGVSIGAGRGSSLSPDCFAAVWLARAFHLQAAQRRQSCSDDADSARPSGTFSAAMGWLRTPVLWGSMS